MANTLVMPGILTNDQADFTAKMTVLAARGGWVHIDVMDNLLVPNKTVDPVDDLDWQKRIAGPPNRELHLMVREPKKYLAVLTPLKITRVVIHQESFSDEMALAAMIKAILDLGVEPGITSNPESELKIRPDVGFYQIMGVKPGYSGQSLWGDTVERTQKIRQNQMKSDMMISVDGGVKRETAASLVTAGADAIVVNSAFWGSAEPDKLITELENLSKGGESVISDRH